MGISCGFSGLYRASRSMPFRFQSVHCSRPAGVAARLYGFDSVVVVVVVVVVVDLVVGSFRSNNDSF